MNEGAYQYQEDVAFITIFFLGVTQGICPLSVPGAGGSTLKYFARSAGVMCDGVRLKMTLE